MADVIPDSFLPRWFAFFDRVNQAGGEVEFTWNQGLSAEDVLAKLTEAGWRGDERRSLLFATFQGGGDYRYEIALPGQDDGRAGTYSGGAVVANAHAITEWTGACRKWAEETWVADYEEERELWTTSLPIIKLANGDYIALVADKDEEVYYLAHDDSSRPIARSFEEFMDHWTRLGLIGPEIWILQNYFDEDSSLLSAESDLGKKLIKRMGLILA